MKDFPLEFYRTKLGAPPVEQVALKMIEEAGEAYTATTTGPLNEALDELADVVITALVTGAALGLSYDEILTAVDRKFAINMNRSWGQQPDGSYHHTKEG